MLPSGPKIKKWFPIFNSARSTRPQNQSAKEPNLIVLSSDEEKETPPRANPVATSSTGQVQRRQNPRVALSPNEEEEIPAQGNHAIPIVKRPDAVNILSSEDEDRPSRDGPILKRKKAPTKLEPLKRKKLDADALGVQADDMMSPRSEIPTEGPKSSQGNDATANKVQDQAEIPIGSIGDTYSELLLDPYPAPAESCMDGLFKEGSKRIDHWFSSHNHLLQMDAKSYLEVIPGCNNIVDMLLSLDDLSGDPYKLIRACNTGRNIKAGDEVVYALVIMTTVGALLKAVKVVKMKETRRRLEIEKEVRGGLEGRKPNDHATAIYGGYTMRLEGRSIQDLLHVSNPKKDTRAPLQTVEQIAGNATSLDKFGYVTYENGVARLHRADGVPATTMPTVLRVPVVALKDIPGSYRGDIEGVVIALLGIRNLNVQSGILSPLQVDTKLLTSMRNLIHPGAHKEILVISEGTRSLESSRTGYHFAQGMRDLQDDPNIVLHEETLPPSRELTDEDAERVVTSIKGRYKLVMVVGATEAWKKVVRNVVDGSVRMGSEFGAFEVGKVRDEDVIFVKVVHPAVINYIGDDAKWIWQMIHKVQAVALVLASFISQSHLATPTDALQFAESTPVVKRELDELRSVGSHSYYAGSVAAKINRYRRDGYTWEDAALMIRSEGGLKTVTSILPREVYTEDTAITIPKSVDRKTDSDIWVPTWAPKTDRHKTPKLCNFVIDKGFRGEEDQKGHIIANPKNEIRFRLLDGSTLSGISEPKTGQQKLWLWNEIEWSSMAMLGCDDELVWRLLFATSNGRKLWDVQRQEINAWRQLPSINRARLVSTLNRETVETGVVDGRLRAHPTVTNISFRFLDPSHEDIYPQVGTDATRSWAIPTVHKKYGSIEYTVALCVEDGHWKFLVFKRDQGTNWEQQLVDDESLKWPVGSTRSWLSRNAESTQLFLNTKAAQDGGVVTEQAMVNDEQALVEWDFMARQSKSRMKKSGAQA